MDNGFSYLMLAFSAALLLYAALLAATKDYNLLPRRAAVAVKPKDSRAYTFQLSKVIALVAVGPALGGLVGLWNTMAGLVVLIVSTVALIWLGTKIMKPVQ